MKKILLLVLSLLLLNLSFKMNNVINAQEDLIKVGYFKFEGYHNYDQGNRSGYGYEYLQNLAKYTSWTYDYIGYDKSWSEMQSMLQNGEIDILTSAQLTPERQDLFSFSDLNQPIGYSTGLLTIKEGNTKYTSDNFDNYKEMKIGAIHNNSRNIGFIEYAKENNIELGKGEDPLSDDPYYYYNDINELTSALQKGEVDAIISSDLRYIRNEWILVQYDTSPYYIIVEKDDPHNLLPIINEAIRKLNINNPSLKTILFQKYYGKYELANVSFDINEKRYIEKINNDDIVLTTLFRGNMPPFSYWENNQALGVVPLLNEEIKNRTKLNFTYLSALDFTTYNDTIANNKPDIIMDFIGDYNLAEELGYKLSNPYIKINYVGVALKNNINNHRIVAAVKNTILTSNFIEKNYLTENIRYYDTYEEAIQAVLKRKVDIIYMDDYQADYQMYLDETNRLTRIANTSYSVELRIAVNSKNEPELLSIIDKTLNSMGSDYVTDMLAYQTNYPYKPFSFVSYFYSNPFLFVIIIIIIFLLTTFSIVYYVNYHNQTKKDELTNQYTQMFCQTYDFVYEFDIKDNTVYQIIMENKYYKRIKKEKTIEELIDYYLKEIVYPDDIHIFDHYLNLLTIQSYVNNQEKNSFECRVRMDNNTYRWYAYTVFGFNNNSNDNKLMIFINDINEIKEQQMIKNNQILEALEMAERASKYKTEFMSRMSHEIRTPLNAILGYMSVAKNHTNSVEKMIDYLNKSELATKQLLAILNDILDMARIDSGKIKIVDEPFDLREIVANMSTIYYEQAKTKKIKFESVLTNVTEKNVIGDQVRLNQILFNLLSNALKFTPEGGTVKLEIIQTAIRIGKVFFRFIISDTGIGMSNEFMEKIFNPFEQVESGNTQRYGGTGLGLSITKNLVTLMNGAINVQSELGIGSTFIVDLPLGYIQKDNLDIRAEIFQHLNVLIYGDDDRNCDYMNTYFTKCGLRCVKTDKYETIMDLMNEANQNMNSFQMVILDMDDINNNEIEIIKKIRYQYGYETPVIVVVSYDNKIINQINLGKDTNFFFTKPIFQSNLFDLLMNAFGKYTYNENTMIDTNKFIGKRVLLVEDNEINMELATEILRNKGFIVDSAINGEMAVEMFLLSSSSFYQVIIMDIRMPIMDGYEATRIIRSSSHVDALNIPIIAMTANAFPEDYAESIAAGLNDHIAKPIDVNYLFKVLDKYIK